MENTDASQEAELAVQQAHEPANAEQGHNKPTETVESVTKAIVIGLFGYQTKHYATHQSEEERRLKMIKI